MSRALYEAARDVVNSWGGNNLAQAVHALDLLTSGMTFATDYEIEAARSTYAMGSDHDIEIDDGAATSVGEDGTWVQAWVFLYREEEA